MGANNIPQAVPNNVIPSDHHNSLRSALIGDYVPRNSSANAENLAGSLGQSSFRWLQGYIQTLFIGTSAQNISIEADGVNNDCVIKVGGQERLRIPVLAPVLPPGLISPYSGDSDVEGWLLCDGREVSRTTYANLFTAVGIRFGEGNTTSTFNIPDFRGRFLRGADNGAGNDPDAGSRSAMNSGGAAGDAVGSIQDDEVINHEHPPSIDLFAPFGNFSAGPQRGVTTDAGAGAPPLTFPSVGGNETRPKNASVNYLIKI